MNAVVYVRVSSKEQVDNLSLPLQERACAEYCRRQGWDVVEVFREEGESAKSSERTQFQRMLRVVASSSRTARKVGVVVVYRVDRFARNQDDHHIVRARLRALGAQLRSVSEPIDETYQGRITEGIFAAFAEGDNLRRSQSTKDGMREALARGRWPWKAPVGYRNVKETGTVEPDPVMSPILREAFEMAGRRHTLPEIVAMTRQRGARVPIETLRKALRSPFYVGRLVAPKWSIDTAGAHPALVDWPTFRRAQSTALETSRALSADGVRIEISPRAYVTGATETFPLKAVCRCAHCGAGLTAYTTHPKGRTYRYYRCFGCPFDLRAAALEAAFAQLLDRLAHPPTRLDLFAAILRDREEAITERTTTQAANARRQLNALRAKFNRLTEAWLYEDGTIDRATYDTQRHKLTTAIVEAESLAAGGTPTVKFETRLEAARQLLQTPLLLWDSTPPLARPALARTLFPDGFATTRNGEIRNPPKCLLFLPLGVTQDPKNPSGTPADLDIETLSVWMGKLEFVGQVAGLLPMESA